MKRLDDLDARFLPAAATRLRALVQRLVARREAAVARARAVPVRDLRTLDARFASKGPLGLFRDVPQVGFVVIALVFLLGAGSAAKQEADLDRLRQSQEGPAGPGQTAGGGPGGEPPAATALGPDIGVKVTSYLKKAGDDLAKAARGSKPDQRLALVSFTDYRTPAQAKALLGDVAVQRVFVRAKAGGKEAAQLPVDIQRDLVAELRVFYAKTAKGRLQAQKAYQTYVDTLEVNTKEDRAFKDLYAAFARSTGVEAREYGKGCACVYSAVVVAPVRQLLSLRTRPGVRGVEVGPQGRTLEVLQVLPLLPEVVATVPPQQAAVEPP